jgi:hypothetical protein
MQATPQPSQTAQPAQAPTPDVVVGGQRIPVSTPPLPLTAQEVAAIRARRAELSNQLISASNRRDEIAEQLLESGGVAREGLEQRLRLLDQRILQLEADIAETGEQLTNAPAGLATAEARQEATIFGFDQEPATAMIIIFILAVLLPLSVAYARRILRRPAPAAHSPALDEIAQRMERMENAVEAVAVEVERISEGQRFVSRLLGEGQRPAEPIRVGEQSGQRVPRGGA